MGAEIGRSTRMVIEMATAHSLDGLMKWLRRDEWSDAFADVLKLHLLPACERAGVEFEDLASIVNDDWVMNTLWGCAFEDFLTRELDDGRNLVDDYLKRRGWKESAATRVYMSALRRSVISLYEISNIVPDTSFLARDLLRGGDPIVVSERSATRSLKPWDRIAARVVRVGSKAVMGGGVLPFDHEASERLLKLMHSAEGRGRKKRRKRADLIASDTNAPTLAEAVSDDLLLQAAAPVFTMIWLHDVLDRVKNPRIPELQNMEGDELMFCTVRFPFAQNAAIQDIRSMLRKQPELIEASPTFWNWIGTSKPVKNSRANRHPGVRQAQTFKTTLDDGSLVLGNIELANRALVLSVNSKARADRGRALITETLGSLIRVPLVKMQTVDQLMASRESRPSPPRSDLSPEEEQTIVHATLDQHYRGLLDEPIPMLGNVSPRAAAKTSKGRAKLVTWLKQLENQSARPANRTEPMATYDVRWLWEELGVADLRR